jgi:NAD(P)-dependent dehydrogenase (short-subunit alcohol dehydrogenase family)
MNDLFDVAGKTALVTGGSRGIGLMIARGLVQAGARVIVSSRKDADVLAAAEQLTQLGECEAIPGDISSPDGAAQLASEVSSRFPELSILVNNAGVVWGAPLEEFPPRGWEKVLNTNLEGIFHLTVALRTPAMENYSYSASKAAVHMLTRHLAKRLAAENVTVNAIAPGPFESKMMAFVLDDPQARRAIEESVPLGRIGRGDDIAGLVLFLASRAGAYMTGTVIPLDGGITGCS